VADNYRGESFVRESVALHPESGEEVILMYREIDHKDGKQ
jgi:hypothetical protein